MKYYTISVDGEKTEITVEDATDIVNGKVTGFNVLEIEVPKEAVNSIMNFGSSVPPCATTISEIHLDKRQETKNTSTEGKEQK